MSDVLDIVEFGIANGLYVRIFTDRGHALSIHPCGTLSCWEVNGFGAVRRGTLQREILGDPSDGRVLRLTMTDEDRNPSLWIIDPAHVVSVTTGGKRRCLNS